MVNDLIKHLEERDVYISPTMKAEILQAQRLSDDVISMMNWFGRVMTALSSLRKNVVLGDAEASKG
ncbi:hypothetical protein [Aliiruegeria lutimaris]|uniref:Uncharacterized protein n=1 Tax=Aliiruegeria lutimaris TaxID=571298 RepID=A0A1G9HYD5_9RHOB|nr:hypothetical protein [Aliiruegeria lutimaris]SDL17978.1 hypothetical protein SAMN04488026_107117 [Aliiruegeria lutimaris]